jgi:SAM-dependent methyltransferase
MSSVCPTPSASFRDPSGTCCIIGERVLRVLDEENTRELEKFLETTAALNFTAQRQLVSTRRLPGAELAELRKSDQWRPFLIAQSDGGVFEHERVPFRSYPYEWPPEMLWEAARLTLELALASFESGYGLKDATPYNVLFRGCEPVFIDVPSFERREPGDPVWRANAQFVRTFLLPLLVNRRWGIPIADVLRTRRDGLEPHEVYRLCGRVQRFMPPMLSLVSVPTWLRPKARARGEQLYERRLMANQEKAQFIFKSLLQRLQRTLYSLKPRARQESDWTAYMQAHTYNEPAFAAKEQFVAEALAEYEPRRVLDIGANTGHFSALAAKGGAEVVAIDLDAACVGAVFKRAQDEKLNILPLVVDLARPTPALGWRNEECPSFLSRAAGHFDAALMLAVTHHLLVTERIPLTEILALAAELTSSLLIIEYVGPEDEMFRELTRGREDLHADLNEGVFEAACARHFEIARSVALPGTHRHLYCLRRKGGRT